MKIIELFITLLLLLLSCLTIAQQETPPAAVQTAVAIEQEVSSTMWVPGTVISRFDSQIASETSGVLISLVDVGQRVSKGDVLARINDALIQIQVKRDETELKRLRAQLAYASAQLKRAQSISVDSSLAQSQVDELKMRQDVLKQELTLADIQLEQTKYLASKTSITAPFTGVVAEQFHQAGEYVGIGEQLLRLVSIEELEITVKAPIEVSKYMLHDAQVPVRNKYQQFLTKVKSVVPVSDERSRMLEVRVTLNESDFIIGEAVEVAFNTGPQQLATLVPRDALVLRENEVYLFRIHDGIAEKVVVIPGIGDPVNIAVSGNLKPGDMIVTRGAERLDSGRKVEVVATINT